MEKKKEETKKTFKPKIGGNSNNNPKKPFSFYWIYAIVGIALLSLQLLNWSGGASVITEAEFEAMVMNNDVEEVIVVKNKGIAKVTLTKEALAKEEHARKIKNNSVNASKNGPHYTFEFNSLDNFDKELKKWSEEKNLKYKTITEEDWLGGIIGFMLPILIIIGIWMFLMKRMSGGAGPGGQIFNIGKSKAQLFDKEKSIKVTFDDVAGLEGAKEEVQEIVDFLKKPEKYTNLGAKIPKGALLVGPPGTGKTLLARAVAGEAKVPFFSLSGSDFVEMFVGVGASRVRDLFKQAKDKSPSIIFIDEIDAIGRARGKGMAQGANDERENTLNQLLTEMDGFGTNTGVIVLAATNRADVLDRALVRPGRFDRQIHVDLPEVHEREEIFKVHLKPLKVDDTVDRIFLAKQTPGFSGADIANICNEAALIAARQNKKQIDKQDFLDAVDRVIGGLEKKNKIISDHERKAIAFHEAGHAAVSWLVKYASPLVKVTIIPRGRSLGAAWYLPEERQITTTEQLKDEMCAALGGRAAEQLMFGKISTGALSDLEKITKQAYAMISIYGLSERLGNISYYDSSGQSDYSFSKPYSEKTAQLIDEEVSKLIDESYQRTLAILEKNKDKLILLAEKLLEKEVIFRDDLEAIFGRSAFEAELKEEKKSSKKIVKTVVVSEDEVDATDKTTPLNEGKPIDESTIEKES
ncbi:MAG: peptidase M41 [Flavobacteriales bacterium CG18_big_fil_WC_8_21_14_2_50_32_9]|nr:ATP-dependent metallopeptidase FtsH/Yme1/Tma family protein [Flavobacteriales bacterium]PIQ16643.1 MAG: peptidase M41 [Flavobacteriales bacterium CG18_big_fil_WC_8_21_14_2_50_32_9]PJC63205.1 MAG: peptidase M41 [Flavobacteriales bacterium CG_4_9_14_0_2_um_filter_32_27]